MTLRQSHFVPPVPLLVAEEHEHCAGLDLRTQRTTGSAEQLRGLLSGEIDLAVTAIDNLFEWTAAGADLRLVAQVERTTPLNFFARPGIEAFADLAGRRFAVDAFANGFSLVARDLLGPIASEVQFIEVGGVRERMEALLSDAADATLLGPPFDGIAEGVGLRRLGAVADAYPAFPGQGLIIRADLIDSAELAAYLRALAAGVRTAEAMTDEEGTALLHRGGIEAAADALWAARARTLHVDPEGLALLTGIRERLGLLPAGIDLTDLHDPRPLHEALDGAS